MTSTKIEPKFSWQPKILQYWIGINAAPNLKKIVTPEKTVLLQTYIQPLNWTEKLGGFYLSFEIHGFFTLVRAFLEQLNRTEKLWIKSTS